MNRLEFEISENVSLVIKTQAIEYNINTFNTTVDILIIENNNELNIGGYYTLFEVLSEMENVIEEILNNNRNVNFVKNFELIKELNKENFEFHITENLKHLDKSNELLKFILFDGNYFVALYNFQNNILLEIGQKYDDFEYDDLEVLKEKFKNWFEQLSPVTYKLSSSLLKDWGMQIKKIKIR
jgi:hypothetical protein